jgi:hypothetical protein
MCYQPLALLPLSRLLGEKSGGVRIGTRRAHEDSIQGLRPRHHVPGVASETRQLVLGTSARKKRAYVRPILHRDRLVVTDY